MHTEDPEESAMRQREELVEDSVADLFTAYDEAITDDVEHPVVIVLDCEDEIGGPIARAWTDDESVDNAILDNRAAAEDDPEADAITTLLIRAVSYEECRTELVESFPYLAGTFEQDPPNDAFIAVAVAASGAATFGVPLSGRD